MKLPIESVQHDSEFDFWSWNWWTVVWPCTDSCCCWIVILYCAFLNCKSYFYLHSCLFGFCLIHVWQCWLGIKYQSQCLSEVTIFIVLSVLCAHSCLEHLSPPSFWMWEFVCIAVSVYACKYTYMREIHVQVHIYAWDSCASTHICMRFMCKYTHMHEIHWYHQRCRFHVCVQVHSDTHAWDSFMPSALLFLCMRASTHICVRFMSKYTHMHEIHLCHQHCCFCICVQVHTHAWDLFMPSALPFLRMCASTQWHTCVRFIYAISIAVSV